MYPAIQLSTTTTDTAAARRFVAIWAASGVIDAVNKLPIFGGVFELVGLGVTSWFAYRYLFNAADRFVAHGKQFSLVVSARSSPAKSAACSLLSIGTGWDCRQELKGEIDDFFKVGTAAMSLRMH